MLIQVRGFRKGREWSIGPEGPYTFEVGGEGEEGWLDLHWRHRKVTLNGNYHFMLEFGRDEILKLFKATFGSYTIDQFASLLSEQSGTRGRKRRRKTRPRRP